MKERPILFSGAMVRALLSNTKTQTRRVVKPQPDIADWQDAYMMSPKDGRARFRPVAPDWPDGDDDDVYCPYGQPGDRLWVRESFAHMYRGNAQPEKRAPEDVAYMADNLTPDPYVYGPWRPSIHMPRWASRITLEVTSVRVEHLQDISEADAKAEGIFPHIRGGWHWLKHDSSNPCDWNQFGYKTAALAFQALWESINGPDSWAANPWVWALNFRHIDKQGGAA